MKRFLLATSMLSSLLLLEGREGRAQSVPNPESPISQGVVWTPAQWLNAWRSKADTSGTSAGNFAHLSAFTQGGENVTWDITTRNGVGVNFIYTSGNVSGVADPAAGVPTGNLFVISGDTINAPSQGFYGHSFYHNFGGPGIGGGHTAMLVSMTQQAPIATGSFYGVLNAHFASDSTVGSGGNAIAFNPQINLGSGASGYGLAEMIEGSINSDTPLQLRGGVSMFSGGTQAGSNDDFAFGLAKNPNKVGWGSALAITRSDSPFSLSPTASIIIAPEMITNPATGNGVMQMAFGVNLPNVYFSNSAWSTSGFRVTGGGRIFADTMQITRAGAGVAMDVSGYLASAPVIAAPGTGYVAGDQLHDTRGGILTVTAIGGGGAITTLAYLVGSDGFALGGHNFGGVGPSPMALAGGRGTGATATVTWTQSLLLALQTSGGTLSINGVAGANCASGTVVLVNIAVRQGIITAC